MMVLPAIATAYAGTVLTGPWMIGQMAPAVAVLLVSSSGGGLRGGVADTLLYVGLWSAAGLVPVWMRGRVNAATEQLSVARTREAERAGAELVQRRHLATALRQSVHEVGGET